MRPSDPTRPYNGDHDGMYVCKQSTHAFGTINLPAQMTCNWKTGFGLPFKYMLRLAVPQPETGPSGPVSKSKMEQETTAGVLFGLVIAQMLPSAVLFERGFE